MDFSPLRRRDYRLLYIGQFVSTFGSMLSYVALPFVLYESTKSTVLTGVLGAIQLVPSVIGGLFGGALADASDRRKLIVGCELGMALVMLALAIAISWRGYPSAPFLLAAAALMAIFNGFHRPALEALTPQLLSAQEMKAASALGSIRFNTCMIGGPAIAGILISKAGADVAFYLDFVTFAACIGCVLAMRRLPAADKSAPFSLELVEEGFRYAMSRQDLVGTYVVDIIAMTFSMPNLLFPAVADAFGDPVYLGWLHSGIAVGALIAALTSGFYRSARHGLIILVAAAVWSLSMIGFGLSTSFPLALGFLVVAGYADGISGVFRQTIWNQTIPSELRGRLAGIEMISYLSGPMLGNTQLGVMSHALGIQRAISISSAVGLAGVLLCGRLLPKFLRYRAGGASASAVDARD